MLNTHNQITCDNCKNILNDGRTLLPGYLVVEDRRVTEYNSIDPNNQYLKTPRNPRLDLMKNRLGDENGNDFVVSKIVYLEDLIAIPKNGDFCNAGCVQEFSKKVLTK